MTVRLVVLGAVTLSVLGMMLVVGGVMATGMFLPGVLLIGLSLMGYAAAGVLEAIRSAGQVVEPVRAPRSRPPTSK
jgi:drug/metabolite transporter (DMT)-like permease